MSQITEETNTKSLNGTSKEQNNSHYLIEREAVEGTPFAINGVQRENEDVKDWYILFGKYRISEKMVSKEIAIEEAKIMDWWKVMSIAHGIAQDLINENNNKK